MFDAPRYPTESFYQKNGQGQNFRKSLPLSSKGSRTYRPTSDSNFRKNPNNIPLKQTSNTIISNEREDISTERSQEKSDTGTQNEEILSEVMLHFFEFFVSRKYINEHNYLFNDSHHTCLDLVNNFVPCSGAFRIYPINFKFLLRVKRVTRNFWQGGRMAEVIFLTKSDERGGEK